MEGNHGISSEPCGFFYFRENTELRVSQEMAKKSMPTYKVKENLFTSFTGSRNLASRSMYKLFRKE